MKRDEKNGRKGGCVQKCFVGKLIFTTLKMGSMAMGVDGPIALERKSVALVYRYLTVGFHHWVLNAMLQV